jgi:hypothetical protein
MTQAQANAYHYWWLVDTQNGGLLNTTTGPAKRLFTMGQFSRFVRPNFNRIDATSSQSSALISAYKDSASPAFAVVVINTNAIFDMLQTVTLTNINATSVTPWMTSSSNSLTQLSAITVANSSFTYIVPAMSVVTFVGQGSTATAPTIGVVADQTINPGQTLLITNTATASDVPPQTFTFGAGSALPTGATIDPSSGIFSWRPTVSQANTTNPVQIEVTDSGEPTLGATNSFNVVVNPLTPATVASITPNGSQLDLMVIGPAGPDYTLLSSTDLVNWQTDYTLSSPTPPVMLVDSNYPAAPAQFYRVQVGP